MNNSTKTDVITVSLSVIERHARMMGSLHTLCYLENIILDGEEAKVKLIIDTMRAIGVIYIKEIKVLDYIREYAPEEETFKQPPEEMVATDPKYFTNTYNRMVQITSDRGGVFFEPCIYGSIKSPACGALENLGRVFGILYVASILENNWHRFGLPDWSYRAMMRVIMTDTLDKHVNVFCSSEGWIDNGKTKGFDKSLQERLDSEVCVGFVTYTRLLAAHEEIRDAVASYFVDGFFEKFIQEGQRGEIQKLLHQCKERLAARRRAVVAEQYDRLGAIDENIRHLLDTLKQYGIMAETYQEAVEVYRQRFPAKSPPQADEESLIEREVRALERAVNWKEVEDRLSIKFPNRVDFIQAKIRQRIEDEERPR